MVQSNPVSRMTSCLVMVRPVITTAAPNVCYLLMVGRAITLNSFLAITVARILPMACGLVYPSPTGGTPHCQTLHPPLKIPHRYLLTSYKVTRRPREKASHILILMWPE